VLLSCVGSSFSHKYCTKLLGLVVMNTLAYLLRASVAKKKFYDIKQGANAIKHFCP
jgi:hypothetical protein